MAAVIIIILAILFLLWCFIENRITGYFVERIGRKITNLFRKRK